MLTLSVHLYSHSLTYHFHSLIFAGIYENAASLVGMRLQSEDSDDDPYQFMYSGLDHFDQWPSSATPNPGGQQQARRMSYNDGSRPDLEDSADDLEPYVRMDTSHGQDEVDLRLMARRANLKVKAKKRDTNTFSVISEGVYEDYIFNEDFIGDVKEKDLSLDNGSLRETGQEAPSK